MRVYSLSSEVCPNFSATLKKKISSPSLVVGKHVITIEGLGNVDKPHPLQERLAKLHGSQ